MCIAVLITYILSDTFATVDSGVYIRGMRHSYSISEFIRVNYAELRKMAGSVLRCGFDDDDIDTLLSNLTLDLHRLRLLDRYSPEACARHGVGLGTVVYRQFKNIIADEALYRRASKRTPDPYKSIPEVGWSEDRVYERLTVKEFIVRLDAPLREMMEYRYTGWTAIEYATEKHLSKATPAKRMLRVRSAWSEYTA